MEKLLIFSFILSISFYTHASNIQIVSDLDDTIKITNSNNLGRALGNGLFSKKVFAGTSELYENLKHLGDIHILSASPKFFLNKTKKLLQKHNIQYKSLTLRNISKEKDVFAYKYRNIVKLIDENPSTKLILIGDNAGEDHKVYQRVKMLYPNNVANIYIRKVSVEPVERGIIEFITTAEIAAAEHSNGRMTLDELEFVKKEVLSSKFDLVVPKFAFCPKLDWINTQAHINLLKDVVDLVKKKCASRDGLTK